MELFINNRIIKMYTGYRDYNYIYIGLQELVQEYVVFYLY